MEEYKLVLESQLGPREGGLRFKEKNGLIRGTLILLGYENPVLGKRTGKTSFCVSHHLHTALSDLECVSVFDQQADRIVGTLRNGQDLMRWYGERLPDRKAEDEP